MGFFFTCFCSRAIHTELLNDLSTDSSINSLHCFIIRSGTIRQNQNFVGAKNAFKNTSKEMDTGQMIAFLAKRQCDFIMNASHASHVGKYKSEQLEIFSAPRSLCPQAG